MNRMRALRSWLIPGLLLGTAVYAIAEEITLTTYYPSPRGAYRELRSTDATYLATDTDSATARVGIGTTNPASRLDLGGGCMTGSICSDRAMKTQITPWQPDGSVLAKVRQLEAASFQWAHQPDGPPRSA